MPAGEVPQVALPDGRPGKVRPSWSNGCDPREALEHVGPTRPPLCQLHPRETPPAVSRMLTPATSSGNGAIRGPSSAAPSLLRTNCMWLSAKDHLRFAIVPWSTRRRH